MPAGGGAARSRQDTKAWHRRPEGFSIHEMYALLAHELAVTTTSRRGGSDSPLHTWLVALEWGASVYGAPAELEWDAVDHELACRGPLEKASLVKRLVWNVPLDPEDRRALQETTSTALRDLAPRNLDAARALRRSGAHDKAHRLGLYAANLEEAARHFWE